MSKMNLDQNLQLGLGCAMEAIGAHPVVKGHVAGKLGKLVRGGMMGGAFVAAVFASTGAMAQTSVLGNAMGSVFNIGCLAGGAAGGLLGNQVGKGTGKTIATAAGAVVGCATGKAMQDSSNTRPQQRAGYQQTSVGIPILQAGGYAPPVVGVHPMGNYMQHAFAQINGQQEPSKPLTAQGQMAMEKAISEAESRMRENMDAQGQYAQAYQQMNNARMNSMNPETQVLMGSQAVRMNAAQYEQQLARASQSSARTNVNFGSAGMRVADLTEFEAAQGYDIRAYGARIMTILSAPMSAPVSGVSPATRQQVTFSTGSVAATPARGPGY